MNTLEGYVQNIHKMSLLTVISFLTQFSSIFIQWAFTNC